MLVYKYVHPDRIDVLENGNIRFTQPYALNDPFDSNPDFNLFKDSIKTRALTLLDNMPNQVSAVNYVTAQMAANRKANEAIAEMKDVMNEDYAILSLTKNRNNLLMWAHYADSHRGFVLGFDSSHLFFKNEELPRVMTPLDEVEYSPDRPIIPPLEELTFENAAYAIFFTKSNHWAYEEELRMMAKPIAADKTIVLFGDVKAYLFNFPKEILKEVIFGYLMSKSLKEKIAATVAAQYQNVILFQAQLDEKVFDLKIVPYRS